MTHLWSLIFRTGAARLYSSAASALAMLIAARVAGPVEYGIASGALAWVTLTGTILYMSLGQVAIHHAAETDGDGWLPPVLTSLLVLCAAFSLLGWIGLSTMRLVKVPSVQSIPAGVLLAACAILPAFIWEQYGSALLIATGRVNLQNRAQMIGRTVSLLAVVSLILLDWGSLGLVLGVVLGQCTVAVFGMRALFHRAHRLVFDWGTTKRLLRGGVRLHLNAIGAFLFAKAALLMVQHYGGPAETGRYQAALDVLTIGMVVTQAATSVLYSHVASVGVGRAWISQRLIVAKLAFLAVAASGIGIVLAPTAMPLVLGSQYREAVRPLQVLLLSLPGMVIAASMAPQWIGRGLFLQASAMTFIVGLISVGLSRLFVPIFGATGAAWATVGAYALSATINGVLALHLNRGLARRPAVD